MNDSCGPDGARADKSVHIQHLQEQGLIWQGPQENSNKSNPARQGFSTRHRFLGVGIGLIGGLAATSTAFGARVFGSDIPASASVEAASGKAGGEGLGPLALPTPEALREYVAREYCVPKFMARVGDPTVASHVLIVFTSLTCPMCRDFHRHVLPALVAKRPQNLAIVVRDYPSDPVALRALGALWSYGARGHDLATQVFEKGILFEGTPQEQLKNLDAFLAKNAPSSPGHTPRDVVMKEGFEAHNRDYQHMGIREVPTAFFVQKRPGGIKAWQVDSLPFPLVAQDILARVKPAPVPSDSAQPRGSKPLQGQSKPVNSPKISDAPLRGPSAGGALGRYHLGQDILGKKPVMDGQSGKKGLAQNSSAKDEGTQGASARAG